MRVSLIDYTGRCSTDPFYAARLLVYTKNTRLTQGKDGLSTVAAMGDCELLAEVDYISKTIRSSWEFVDYTFQIEGVTRAFTHQFVRTRTASYAQQAQRVVDMSDFEALVPESVEKTHEERTNELAISIAEEVWESHITDVKRTYKILRGLGIPAEDARGILPTNVLTNIVAKMNLRTLADLIGKRTSLRAQGEYRQVAAEMAARVLEVHPWADAFLHPAQTHTPALDALLESSLGRSAPIDKPFVNAALKELDALKGTWG